MLYYAVVRVHHPKLSSQFRRGIPSKSPGFTAERSSEISNHPPLVFLWEKPSFIVLFNLEKVFKSRSNSLIQNNTLNFIKFCNTTIFPFIFHRVNCNSVFIVVRHIKITLSSSPVALIYGCGNSQLTILRTLVGQNCSNFARNVRQIQWPLINALHPEHKIIPSLSFRITIIII